MQIDGTPPGAPPPERRSLVLPLVLIGIGCVGFIASWGVTLFGKDLGAPLSGWLEATFGPEGVGPGRKLAADLFVLVACLGVLVLFGMTRRRVRTDPEVQAFWADWRARMEVWVLFVGFLAATIASVLGVGSETRSGWLYEHWGPLGVRLGSIAIFGALTVLSALYLVHLTRKIHNHPLYRKKPRRD
jgi:hypothetical protein